MQTSKFFIKYHNLISISQNSELNFIILNFLHEQLENIGMYIILICLRHWKTPKQARLEDQFTE